MKQGVGYAQMARDEGLMGLYPKGKVGDVGVYPIEEMTQMLGYTLNSGGCANKALRMLKWGAIRGTRRRLGHVPKG